MFGVAWSIIYICEGIASFLVYQTGGNVRLHLALYALTLCVTAMWPTVFFSWHMIKAATVHLFVILVLVIALTIVFGRVQKTAAYFLLPFLIWISLANTLQVYIFMHN